jgi:UDP-glucose 4-epimerase
LTPPASFPLAVSPEKTLYPSPSEISKKRHAMKDLNVALSGKRVLVTGGSGFIGSHLVEELLRCGVDVTVLKRPISDWPDHLSHIRKDIRLLQMDIQDARFESLLCEEPFDTVFHLAGMASVPQSIARPYDDFTANAVMSLRLLEILRNGCPATVLINASSVAVYGNPVKLPMAETDETIPISPYGVSKSITEQYVTVYSQLYKIPAVSLRLFSTYGPRQRQLVVYDFIEKLHANSDSLTLLGDGTATRDLIYVRDVVRAILIVCEHGRFTGEIYNVATGIPHSILHIAEAVARAMSVTPEIKVTGQARVGDPDKWCADVAKIKTLRFTAETTLEQGIAETLEWYRNAV